MKQPHKHAELIKAWADGAVIQYLDDERWYDCFNNQPMWDSKYEYRIKPEPKPDVIKYARVGYDRVNNAHHIDGVYRYSDNLNGDGGFTSGWAGIYVLCGKLKLTFHGETGELKNAEVIK